MSNVLNDLIITDVAGFSAGDSLTPGAGLVSVADSAIITPLGDPAMLAEGDTI